MTKQEKELLSDAILKLHCSMEDFIVAAILSSVGNDKAAMEYTRKCDNRFDEAQGVLLDFVNEE